MTDQYVEALRAALDTAMTTFKLISKLSNKLHDIKLQTNKACNHYATVYKRKQSDHYEADLLVAYNEYNDLWTKQFQVNMDLMLAQLEYGVKNKQQRDDDFKRRTSKHDCVVNANAVHHNMVDAAKSVLKSQIEVERNTFDCNIEKARNLSDAIFCLRTVTLPEPSINSIIQANIARITDIDE